MSTNVQYTITNRLSVSKHMLQLLHSNAFKTVQFSTYILFIQVFQQCNYCAMATSNSKSDFALFRQYVSQELYHHNCRVHSRVMYLQPLKSNIISRVKPPHTIHQPGLWAAEHVCHLPHGHLLVNASPHLFSLRQQLQEYTLLYGMLEGYVVSLNCLFIQHEYSKNCMNFHAIQERNKAIVDIRLCLQ